MVYCCPRAAPSCRSRCPANWRPWFPGGCCPSTGTCRIGNTMPRGRGPRRRYESAPTSHLSALRRRHRGTAELQFDAVEDLLVIRRLGRPQSGKRLGGARQVSVALCRRIAAAIVGRRHQQQGHSVGVGYDQLAPAGLHAARFHDGAKHGPEFHARGFQLRLFGGQPFRLKLGVIQALVWATASPVMIRRSGAAASVWLSCSRVSAASSETLPGRSLEIAPRSPGRARRRTPPW